MLAFNLAKHYYKCIGGNMSDTDFTVVELFAGIGGFRLGFERAGGFKTIYSNDFDSWCKKTYDNYFGLDSLDLRDIQKVNTSEIPDCDVLTAGFPCQPFSKIGKLHGFADARGTLFWDVLRILKAKQPKAFVLENVANLLKHDKGNTFKTILDGLVNDLDYDVHYEVLNTKGYGLPQDRKRIYIVGFREKTDFRFPEPVELKIKVGDILEKDEIHDHYYMSQIYMDGLEKHKLRHESKGHGFGYRVLDPNGISTTCVVGNMGRERNLIQDKVKPIGRVNKTGSPLNNKGIRKLTIREYARLQGFPDDFKFPDKVTVAYKQIGNAVSVPVAFAVAEKVKEALLAAQQANKSEYVIPKGLDLAKVVA
jgi:DNA (cytosine-5)-methyltransferase 1